ncbi:MAG TPA: 3-dehydroquinate synthase [Gammaproteobacteria bacterium]|nr:3-dehydroquinate synthase [Gammaproteobacteria bacterium]
MKTIHVELGERAYPIHIGDGLLPRGDLISPHVAGTRVMVVTNDIVAPLYLDALMAALTDFDCHSLVLPDGESFKNMEVLNGIFDALLERRFPRDATLIALGGGVIGDITGFAAACYQRGIAHVQVPTTLLAQVDSSVGGKTAVNHRLGKNMIGAFHQPSCVLADTATLHSLPPREFRAGIAEVIKYGLIRDADFLEWIEANVGAVLDLEPEALSLVIERSCRNKSEVVAEDERESGARALLNFGHTFGHAIETGLGYGTWLHGEAVAAGMCLAASLSARLGFISTEDAGRVEKLLERAGLPTRLPETLDGARMLELMAIDKKVLGGRTRLVLLEALGRAVVSDDFDPEVLRDTLAHGRSAA